MPSNFLQWNPSVNNQEDDAAFAGDSQRIAGATSPSEYSALLGNKCFFQWSIFAKAFNDMLTAKGYAPSDGATSPSTALANLISVYANVITNADLAAILTPPSLHKVTLGSNVAVGTSQTVVLSEAVTFPSVAGATYRVDVRYCLWAQVGPNVMNAAVVDATNSHVYASSGMNTNGSGYVGLTGSDISSTTYAAGSTATFELVAISNAGGTNALAFTDGPSTSPAQPSFLAVLPILATW